MSLLLTVVIPAYNEERRIGRSLGEILKFLSAQPYRAEVIVVDDGSSDGTAEVVRSQITEYRKSGIDLQVLVNSPNRGKGYSVKRGIAAASGEIVLFTDADLSSPITEAPKLIDPIATGIADVTFGSRAIDRDLIGVHQPFIRDFGGRVFNFFMKTITGLKFKDTQCGFKAFRRAPSLEAFKLQRIDRFGFDPEVLYIARKHGLRLAEVPVRWNDAEGSKVSYMRDSLKMFGDLLIIRKNDLAGLYDRTEASKEAEQNSGLERYVRRP